MDLTSDIMVALGQGSFCLAIDMCVDSASIVSSHNKVTLSLRYQGQKYRATIFTSQSEEYYRYVTIFATLAKLKSSPFAHSLHLVDELRLSSNQLVDMFLVCDNYWAIDTSSSVANIERWIACSPFVVDDIAMAQDERGLAVITSIENITICGNGKEVDFDSFLPLANTQLAGYFCSDRYIPAPQWCEGLLVMQDIDTGLWGIVDGYQQLVHDFVCQDISDFCEGHAVLCINGKWGLIDRCGNYLLEPIYQDVEMLWEVNLVKVQTGGLYSLLNRDMQATSDLQFRYIGSFNSGRAVVELESGEYNFVDLTGQLVSDKHFDVCEPFIDSLAKVSRDGKSFYIDCQGEIVLP